MNCVYCQGKTGVTNSRKVTKGMGIWRRRQCKSCRAVMTSNEHYDLQRNIRVERSSGSLEPFLRDRLFVDLYQSVSHRKSALADATALTDTVITQVLPHNSRGLLKISQITEAVRDTLKRFDKTALSYYEARH